MNSQPKIPLSPPAWRGRSVRGTRHAWRVASAAACVFVAAVLGAAGGASAQTCPIQASAAIVLSPNHGQNCMPGGPPPGPDVLTPGEAITTTVSVVNTSTRNTGTFPNCGAAAQLTGFTHIDLSCSSASCTNQLSAITFVSCVHAT